MTGGTPVVFSVLTPNTDPSSRDTTTVKRSAEIRPIHSNTYTPSGSDSTCVTSDGSALAVKCKRRTSDTQAESNRKSTLTSSTLRSGAPDIILTGQRSTASDSPITVSSVSPRAKNTRGSSRTRTARLGAADGTDATIKPSAL